MGKASTKRHQIQQGVVFPKVIALFFCIRAHVFRPELAFETACGGETAVDYAMGIAAINVRSKLRADVKGNARDS